MPGYFTETGLVPRNLKRDQTLISEAKGRAFQFVRGQDVLKIFLQILKNRCVRTGRKAEVLLVENTYQSQQQARKRKKIPYKI